jgi:hypothetical protein
MGCTQIKNNLNVMGVAAKILVLRKGREEISEITSSRESECSMLQNHQWSEDCRVTSYLMLVKNFICSWWKRAKFGDYRPKFESAESENRWVFFLATSVGVLADGDPDPGKARGVVADREDDTESPGGP